MAGAGSPSLTLATLPPETGSSRKPLSLECQYGLATVQPVNRRLPAHRAIRTHGFALGAELEALLGRQGEATCRFKSRVCNHPNCLVLPFSLELVRLAI
jgi:hypothetical protein